MRRVGFCRNFLLVIGTVTLLFAGAAKESAASVITSSVGDITTFIYFTGIGCPHCANIDPVLLKQKVRQEDLLVVEYEIYQESANAMLLMIYDNQYKSGLGVPLIVADEKRGGSVVGDTFILEKMNVFITKYKNNGVVLPAGNRPIETLPINDIPRLPKLWFKNRIAIKKDVKSDESDAIKAFLFNNILPEKIAPVHDKDVALSGDKVTFREAFAFNGWILMRD